jgi:hypothetical protein
MLNKKMADEHGQHLVTITVIMAIFRSLEGLAFDYATNQNEAIHASVTLRTEALTLTATIPHQPFLMGIFGIAVITRTASAFAGYYLLCSLTVFSITCSCHPPLAGGEPITNICDIQWSTLNNTAPLCITKDSYKIPEEVTTPFRNHKLINYALRFNWYTRCNNGW